MGDLHVLEELAGYPGARVALFPVSVRAVNPDGTIGPELARLTDLSHENLVLADLFGERLQVDVVDTETGMRVWRSGTVLDMPDRPDPITDQTEERRG